MPISKFGPEELEPFLSVYDRQNRSRQLVREPAYAARLQSIYDNPVSDGGYTYGSALSGRKKALQGLATGHSGLRAMEEVQTDLQKDADRRRFIMNQAQVDQRLEDMRGRNIGGFANLLTQAIGYGTAPIRPGGEKYGEFKQALETAGQKMKAQQGERREGEQQRLRAQDALANVFWEEERRLPTPAEVAKQNMLWRTSPEFRSEYPDEVASARAADRRDFIETIRGMYGRPPNLEEWALFREDPDWAVER